MLKTWKALVGTAVLALGLSAGVAQAAFITGSITVADGLTGLPAAPSGSVVSALSGIDHDGNGNSSGCTGAFVGTCGAGNSTMTDWLFAGPFSVIIQVGIYTFTLTSHGAITPSALVCGGAGTCNDGLLVASLAGVVDDGAGGADPTAFTGFLSLSGTCLGSGAGAGATCSSDLSGGYTYSLSATGKNVVPEPATLLLIGIALTGLGFARRKSA